jgi:transposase InsO family protein
MAGEEVPMSLRRLIVEVDTSTMNVTEFCREHQVSTWLFWELRRRFAAGGEAALAPRSRSPKRVANKTSFEVEEAIVAMRKELADAGWDAGPASIAYHLRDLAGVPSDSTIWRILKARGLIVDQPAKAHRRSGRRFSAARANESWPLDDTDWALADGTPVKILNVLDDHSRLLVAAAAVERCTGAAAFAALAPAAAVLGWPQRIFSDNAKAFRYVLAEAVACLGVAASHTRPYRPQTNGKVERFHQTLKRWLAAQSPATTMAELQTQLDWFRYSYNHHRPHRALGRRTPASVWEQAPKSGPADRPLDAASTIHYSLVGRDGRISVGTRWTINLGTTYRAQTATTVLTGLAAHVFIDGRLIRAVTIDPTRRHQPRNPQPLP